MRESGFKLTPSEQAKVAEAFQEVLRTLTRAGFIIWRRSEATYYSEFGAELATGVRVPGRASPTFLASLQIEVGMLEEILEFPDLKSGSSGHTEISAKLQMLSDGDEDSERQEELTISLQPDLLATIQRTVREYEELLLKISKIGGVQ